MSSEQRVSWWRGTSLGEERGLEGERGRLSGALPPPSVSLSLRPLSPCPFAGCELNQERPTWTFKPQKVGKQDCGFHDNSAIAASLHQDHGFHLVSSTPPSASTTSSYLIKVSKIICFLNWSQEHPGLLTQFRILTYGIMW